MHAVKYCRGMAKDIDAKIRVLTLEKVDPQ
jgi:hypothetical protein